MGHDRRRRGACSSDGGTAWIPVGRIAGTPTAFAANGDDLYASVQDRGIFHSRDAGVTWTKLLSEGLDLLTSWWMSAPCAATMAADAVVVVFVLRD